MKSYHPHCSSLGRISANLLALAMYIVMPLFGWVGFVLALVVFFSEKNSGLVRFHSAQAAILWVGRQIVVYILSLLGGAMSASWLWDFDLFNFFGWTGSVILSLLQAAVTLCVLLFCVLGAVNAYRWNEWHVPFVGSLAEKMCARAPAPYYNGDGPVPPQCEITATQPRSGANNPYASPNGAAPNQPNQPGQHPYQAPQQGAPYSAPPSGAGGSAGGSPHGPAPAGAGVTAEQQPQPPAAPPSAPAPPSAKADPNAQLPTDMRDPPQPTDMFD